MKLRRRRKVQPRSRRRHPQGFYYWLYCVLQTNDRMMRARDAN